MEAEAAKKNEFIVLERRIGSVDNSVHFFLSKKSYEKSGKSSPPVQLNFLL